MILSRFPSELSSFNNPSLGITYYLSTQIEDLNGLGYAVERLSQQLLDHKIPLRTCEWSGASPSLILGHMHDRKGKLIQSYTIMVKFEINPETL